MTLEAMRAADLLAQQEIEAEVIDVRSLKPLDDQLILESVRKTGRFIAADTGWRTAGFSAELVARVAEEVLSELKCPPRRVTLPDCPTPATPALANVYYPRAIHIVATTLKMLGRNINDALFQASGSTPLDIPDMGFRGPF